MKGVIENYDNELKNKNKKVSSHAQLLFKDKTSCCPLIKIKKWLKIQQIIVVYGTVYEDLL